MPDMGNKSLPTSPPAPALSGLANALFSSTRQKVLAFLFGQPERSFYTSELITLAGSGSGAVQRELTRLTQSGLATMKRVGNQTHYQANVKAPIFDEIYNIVEKTVGLIGPMQSALEPLSDDIRVAFVYGSVASRRDHAGSDVDLMVISDTLSYSSIFTALEPVTARIGRDVNPTLYTHDEFIRLRQEDNAFVRHVTEQPKLWVLGSEDDIPTG